MNKKLCSQFSMHSMQRTEVFFLVHRLLPGFELQTSDVPKQQMKTPGNRCTGKVTASNVSVRPANRIQTLDTTEMITINRRIRFQRSTQQISTPANRRTGDRRQATGDRRPASVERIQTPSVADKMPQLEMTVNNTICTFRSNFKTELTRTAISPGFYRKKVAGYRPAAHSAQRFKPTARR